MNPRVKAIIRNLIIYLCITVVFAIAFHLYYGNIYTKYILIYGTVISLIVSKSFLLPFAKIKIEGTVIKTKVATYISASPARGLKGTRELRISVKIKTHQGRKFIKTFEFNGDADDLPIGTKIRFTIFDDRPEVLKYPHFKKPQNEKY